MAKTCIASPKSENQTIDKSQSPIFPRCDFPTVRKSNRINNTNSFNNTNYLIRGKKKYKKFQRKRKNLKKTLGSFSIITEGNSQP